MNAVFLDRDDTILIDPGYLHDPQEIKYFPWTMDALRLITSKGFELFLVTNQSGIGRGYYSENEMNNVNDQIQEDLKTNGIKLFKDIAFCPHRPDESCECRKPNAKMLINLITKYSINTNDSYMVGDKESDAEAGKKAGLTGIILSDHKHSKFKTFKNLLEFALNF